MKCKYDRTYQNITTENPKLNITNSKANVLDFGNIFPNFKIMQSTAIVINISISDAIHQERVWFLRCNLITHIS